MITHNGTYLLHATHHGMPIVAATMGGKMVIGYGLLSATLQAIVAAFGAEGTEVIRKTNDYLNRIATTDPQRALLLAGFINEDPLNGVGIGQFFTNAELQAVADAQLIATKKLDDGSCWVRILHHHIENGIRVFASVAESEYNVNSELFSLLKFISLWTLDNKYEFLSEEYYIEGGQLSAQRRWRQTSNPYTEATLSGFENVSNASTGLKKYIENADRCVMYTTPSWWGAMGARSIYNGGLPAIDGVTINKGTLDLWIRIS
jgi:hypothetical protein